MELAEIVGKGSGDASFDARAMDFLRDLNNEEGFKILHRDIGHNVRGFSVGIGKHDGLVFKDGSVSHAQRAVEFYDELTKYFKLRGYEPNIYELIRPRFVAVGETFGIVQDYFNEPTLSELLCYLLMRKEIGKKERKLQKGLDQREMERVALRFFRYEDSKLRCEQLLREQSNSGITLEDMEEVKRELYADAEYLRIHLKQDNVIVVGQRKAEDAMKIRLAIIDY